MSSFSNQLLRVDDAAAILAVCPKTIYRMIEDGRLDAVRLGDGPKPAIRIRPAAIERLLTPLAA